MSRRGNPQAGLTLPVEELELVDAYADARGLTRSKALHELVRWALGDNLNHNNAVMENLKTEEPTTQFVRDAVAKLNEMSWQHRL